MAKQSGWWWPAIYNETSARKAAGTGATCAYVVAGVTALLATISIFAPLSFIDPTAFVDAALAAFLGFMIQRKVSRIAALAALVMFVGERVYGVVTQGPASGGIVLAIILLFGFISGIRGTFAWHAYRRAAAVMSPSVSDPQASV